MAVKGGQQPRGGTGPSCGSRSALMMTVLACFVHSTQSTTFMDDAEERPARRLLASGEEFAMQQPQFITRPAGAPGVPLMKAAVNGKPVYYFQPSQSIASSSLGTPPTYVIDPRILRKAQLNTLRARVNHARNRAQSLEGEGEGGSDASILDVAAFAFVAVGGTLLVFIRVGIPSAFVK